MVVPTSGAHIYMTSVMALIFHLRSNVTDIVITDFVQLKRTSVE